MEHPGGGSRRLPHILYLVHRFPFPPDKGDRIRAYQVIKFLSRRAHVHVACLADEPVTEESVAQLGRHCHRLVTIPLGGWKRWARACYSIAMGKTVTEGAFASRTLRAKLGEWASDCRYQSVLVSASSLVPYLQLPGLRGLPAVVDLVDVDSQKWLDYAARSSGPRAWLHRLEGTRLRRLEREISTWAECLTLVSEAEADLCRKSCLQGRIEAIGNGVDLDYFTPRACPQEEGCVFVGALDYRPNVEGAVWFCRDVWPALHRLRPEARLRLVGRRPVPAVQRLTEVPGVELVGQVDDVRPFLERAAVAVVPLEIARGLQNKVLEALAMGKATVVSPQALEGIYAEPGVHLLEARTKEDWVATVSQLLADPGLRRQLGSAGRRFVEQEHRWDHCLRRFASLLGLDEPSDSLCAEEDPWEGCVSKQV